MPRGVNLWQVGLQVRTKGLHLVSVLQPDRTVRELDNARVGLEHVGDHLQQQDDTNHVPSGHLVYQGQDVLANRVERAEHDERSSGNRFVRHDCVG